MIDLEQAAADLTAAVSTTPPAVAGVRVTAGRRRRRRHAVGGFLALALVAGSAAAIAATRDGVDHDDVRTGPGPTQPGPAPEPVLDGDGRQILDVGALRIAVPATWWVGRNSCGTDATVMVGDQPGNISCYTPPGASRHASVRILERDLDDDLATSSSTNGIPYDGPLPGGGGLPTYLFPTLDIALQFADDQDLDVDAILDTIGPSARHTALTDLESNAPSDWQMNRGTWQPITFDGVVAYVPRSWPTLELPHDTTEPPDACAGWDEGPAAATGPSSSPRCEPAAVANPIDGVWLLPLEGTTADGDEADDHTTTVGQQIQVIRATGNVLEAIVPARGDDPAVLVRIGLGVDGHVAGAILNSISRVEEPPEPGPEAIVLPCGPLVVGDQANLDLPDDLDVAPVVGLGGGASDDPDTCAVHLTSATSPGRHITFARGPLPFAIGDELGGVTLGNRNLRWGTIHEGYGAELDSGIDGAERIHVLAYGIDEEEAAALFTSLGLT